MDCVVVTKFLITFKITSLINSVLYLYFVRNFVPKHNHVLLALMIRKSPSRRVTETLKCRERVLELNGVATANLRLLINNNNLSRQSLCSNCVLLYSPDTTAQLLPLVAFVNITAVTAFMARIRSHFIKRIDCCVVYL